MIGFPFTFSNRCFIFFIPMAYNHRFFNNKQLLILVAVVVPLVIFEKKMEERGIAPWSVYCFLIFAAFLVAIAYFYASDRKK